MFPAFTGNSRRPRVVNLSGRTTDPFAQNARGRQAPRVSNPEIAISFAQKEREERQYERARLNAARLTQRVWRGILSRKESNQMWRSEWDSNEQALLNTTEYLPGSENFTFPTRRPIPYATANECLNQLRLLIQFMSAKDNRARIKWDSLRLVYFVNALQQTFHSLPSIATEGEWTKSLRRLALVILSILKNSLDPAVPNDVVEPLLEGVVFLIRLIPTQMALISAVYFKTMASLTINSSAYISPDPEGPCIDPQHLKNAIFALLEPITSETLMAYGSFAQHYLKVPDLEQYLGRLDDLANRMNCRILSLAVSSQLDPETAKPKTLEEVRTRIWLLAYVIFFHRYALGGQASTPAPDLEFLNLVSELLTFTVTYIAQGIEADEPHGIDSPPRAEPLHPFVKDQVTSLVDQSSITALLSPTKTSNLRPGSSDGYQGMNSNENVYAEIQAHVLATYGLNLLRLFPRRADDIRMWLYLASAPSDEKIFERGKSRLPAVKYFWRATRSNSIFTSIFTNPSAALRLLQKPEPAKDYGRSRANNQLQEGHSLTPRPIKDLRRKLSRHRDDQTQLDETWKPILLFFELYTFLLKVMDDEEFFSGTSSFTLSDDDNVSWTRASALSLDDVKELTVFLKNLAFTLYWNAADLTEEQEPRPANLSTYFSTTTQASEPYPPFSGSKEPHAPSQTSYLPGITGVPIDYFKGLVTGLLRMLHERDSRRNFLPRGHWLMTDQFDMNGFIPAVVAEEEARHELQINSDDWEDSDDDDYPGDQFLESPSSSGLVGTGHAQQTIRNEALRRNQKRASRKRTLAAINPRLEILRNMPFFIPFLTRVNIFREFIFHDQYRRRHGLVDPDSWRAAVTGGSMNMPAQTSLVRQHARIRRENIFEDALDQFYELGEGLKEPIQISFIDRFGALEAGIDGGGVTKEFLTSITTEAFSTDGWNSMFVENDQHLLYPNPTSTETCKQQLQGFMIPERSVEWNEGVRNHLRSYEFLGRVIGKCLYEGILVDVNFAPFFLLKWALTGGRRSALRESSYRANLNDLKDLDVGLYKGLLKLKNYNGNVEDFSLDFTVNDEIPTSSTSRVTTTKELRPNGADMPVTNQNRLVYISYIARYRLQIQPQQETNAFLTGLGQIIQPSWLSMFNQSELQTLVSGEEDEINVEDLRRNSVYGGVYELGDDGHEHPTIMHFWQVLHEMTPEERQAVVRFVTSTPRAPLLGFSHLNPPFSIRDSGNDQERLPTTSTCVNLLKLPVYRTPEALREKLLYAVSAGAGFDLS
ncbi:uncharacterized protein N7483_011045 [Penicillium malachiteum]|uniref:uncharacterized protein n=1 Tax=Penicillium malachiteum TaxID=1324776 RepID=UPI0025491311|nr:uncharacterized protein N7483_011045 [Penicillium malachiteum]KAJ5713864.1 hypothetical protein N7483_011045 [Penicillium malachiteum]